MYTWMLVGVMKSKTWSTFDTPPLANHHTTMLQSHCKTAYRTSHSRTDRGMCVDEDGLRLSREAVDIYV
jgi:hypothetical protein